MTSSLPPVVTDLNVIPSCNFKVQFASPHKVKQYTGIKEVGVVYVVFALTLFLVSFAVSTPQPFSHVVKKKKLFLPYAKKAIKWRLRTRLPFSKVNRRGGCGRYCVVTIHTHEVFS